MKKGLLFLLIFAIVSPLITVFILYRLAMATDLPGRRGGSQDAFRHTYSCALTARYLSPKVVEWVTTLTERDPHSLFDQMDRHNNRIGTQIGLGKGELYETVMKKVKSGQINATDQDVITWLPENKWDNGF